MGVHGDELRLADARRGVNDRDRAGKPIAGLAGSAIHLLCVDLISERGIYEEPVVEENNIWLSP